MKLHILFAIAILFVFSIEAKILVKRDGQQNQKKDAYADPMIGVQQNPSDGHQKAIAELQTLDAKRRVEEVAYKRFREQLDPIIHNFFEVKITLAKLREAILKLRQESNDEFSKGFDTDIHETVINTDHEIMLNLNKKVEEFNSLRKQRDQLKQNMIELLEIYYESIGFDLIEDFVPLAPSTISILLV